MKMGIKQIKEIEKFYKMFFGLFNLIRLFVVNWGNIWIFGDLQ